MNPLQVQNIFYFPEPRDKRQLQGFIGIVNYISKFLPNLASTAPSLVNLPGTSSTCRWTETHLQAFNPCKELINNRQVIKPCANTSEKPKYLICDASDIGLGSCLGQGIFDRIKPARLHCRKFNPAHWSYPTLQKELLAIIDSPKFFAPQLRGTKFPMLTDYKGLETFMDRTQASQKLRRWQEFLASFEQTIVHTADKVNFIADAISRNYIRMGTLTEEPDCIPASIDNTTLHRTPTLHTPPNIITCDHFSIPTWTPDMSEYQSCVSDFSHPDCEFNMCRSRGNAASHHHTCPYQDDDDWQQFGSYSGDTELRKITGPTEP